MKKVTYVVAIFCLFFLGCKKDKNSLSPEEKQKIEANKAVIYGIWKLESFKKNGSLITSNDPCYADNTIEFRQDGKAILSQGTCIDNPNAPREDIFNWNFITSITINLGGDLVEIATLTNTSLQFTRTFQNSSTPKEEYKWKK